MIERDPASGLPISPSAAHSAGLARYFTGKPCKNGHVAERLAGTRECIECRRGFNAKFYAARIDEQRSRCLKYATENKEAIREKRRQNPEISRRACSRWAKKFPEKRREVNNRRRARKYASADHYKASDISDILTKQKGKCAYCRVRLSEVVRHIDHIVPLAAGGSNGRRNIQILCQPCNQSKSDRDPIVFAQALGRLL